MNANELSAIQSAGRAIAPLHEPIAMTQEGDWLDEHEEPGQSFEEYRRGDPVRPTKLGKTMYLQPLGDFDPARTLQSKRRRSCSGASTERRFECSSEWTWHGCLNRRGGFTRTRAWSKS